MEYDEDGLATLKGGNWSAENPRWKNHSPEGTVKIAERIANTFCGLAEDGDLGEFLGGCEAPDHYKDVLALAEEKAVGKPYLQERVRVARGQIEMALAFKHTPPLLPLNSGKVN
jgi:hypothetical protein